MKSRIRIALLSCVFLATSAMACDYDRARLLALDEAQFDQYESGWRALASKPGCDLAAADLLRDYRQAHRNEAGLLYWHEGQLRAMAGQSREAIALMERARKPADADRAGWNPYVDATVAFLRRDRPALDDARVKLAAVAPPVGKDIPPVVNGYMEADYADGQKRKIRWPPNIDIVECLARRFDKPYGEAYANECP
jgi:hypothetical protein